MSEEWNEDLHGEITERWWFCLKHMRVEPDEGCPNKDRMGPYPTRAQAAAALQTAAERNEAWRKDDKKWDDD
ncbi:hypothetical protein AB0K60_10760 [Thermopolyspora sp. NPDC052614]|uniref:hypothetical protein n=1 Tax=Thermopolyspora sp. NPDC052614 TaxID=3155682 RepID=UPI003442C328